MRCHWETSVGSLHKAAPNSLLPLGGSSGYFGVPSRECRSAQSLCTCDRVTSDFLRIHQPALQSSYYQNAFLSLTIMESNNGRYFESGIQRFGQFCTSRKGEQLDCMMQTTPRSPWQRSLWRTGSAAVALAAKVGQGLQRSSVVGDQV